MKKQILALMALAAMGAQTKASFIGMTQGNQLAIQDYHDGRLAGVIKQNKQALCNKYRTYVMLCGKFWEAERTLLNRPAGQNSICCDLSRLGVYDPTRPTSYWRDLITAIATGATSFEAVVASLPAEAQYIGQLKIELLNVLAAEVALDAVANGGVYVNHEFMLNECPADVNTKCEMVIQKAGCNPAYQPV